MLKRFIEKIWYWLFPKKTEPIIEPDPLIEMVKKEMLIRSYVKPFGNFRPIKPIRTSKGNMVIK